MKRIALAFYALALAAGPVLAEDFVGGAVKTSEIDGKTVLTNSEGMSLYTWKNDAVGVSNCYEQCAANWPPLLAAADAAPEGDFSLVDRTDGSKVWAYKGWPLYLWVRDEKPGDVSGDGVGGTWVLATQ